MSAILKRKMTLKSKLGFGRYNDMRVSDIINIKNHAGTQYLIWVYYTMKNMDFEEETLMRLRITPKFRIEKPGFSKKMMLVMKDEMFTEKEKEMMLKEKNFAMAQSYAEFREKDRLNFSNKKLQARNHGHIN